MMLWPVVIRILTPVIAWVTLRILFAFSSPLRAIPNAHFTTPVSRIWILWTRFTGKEFSKCLELHNRLGPVIRIGPREISVNCIEGGVRTVYGGNWEKSSMYDNFTQFGFSPLFAMRDTREHLERKRLFTSIYSKSTISRSTETSRAVSSICHQMLVRRLQKQADERKSVDVYSLTKECSMDIITAYIYGKKNGTNWVVNPTQAAPHLSAFQRAADPWSFFASTEMPKLVAILNWFGIKLISPTVDTAFDHIHSFVLGITTRAIDTCRSSLTKGDNADGVIEHVWQKLEDFPKADRLNMIASDMVDQLHAGHLATGVVLTYLMLELSRNPDIQERLSIELATSDDPQASGTLDAVIMETIRMYPAGFGPFPRVAPANATVAGFAVPKNTIVTASPYMLGRNSNIFPRPDKWLPERWLQAGPDQTRIMRQWTWMFMSGQRICVGQHLAVLAMKSMMVAVYSHFRTFIIGKPNMKQFESFFSIPADNSLYLGFNAIPASETIN